MKRKRKKQKLSLSKHAFTDQPCQLCGEEDKVDENTALHFCDRCTLQRAQGAATMPMLVIETGECEKCGAETNQILRTMSKDKNKITEKFLCSDCYEVHEPEDPKKLPKSNRPAGWRFMKQFVDADGTVYQLKEFKDENGAIYTKSVECPELKGTLPPTDVEKVKAAQKEKRKEKKKKKAERLAKKEARLAKEYKKKMKKKAKEEQKQSEEDRKAKFFEET